jgi:hypothetical protein
MRQASFPEAKDALDDFCNSLSFVAAGNGEFLHAGRLHSHTARDCGGGALNSIDLRPQVGSVTVLLEQIHLRSLTVQAVYGRIGAK